jgi:predicted nuclease of predicted toxin-antitoxin system
MPAAFYFDVPVNKAIALGLRLRGVETLTAQEDGYDRAPDEDIMTRALELHRPVMTTDHDFLVLAKLMLQREQPFSGVIFVRFTTPIGYAVEELEVYAKAGETQDFLNRVIFL